MDLWTQTLKEAADELGNLLMGIVTDAPAFLARVGGKFKEGVSGAWSAAKTTVSSAVGTVREAFTPNAPAITKEGSGMVAQGITPSASPSIASSVSPNARMEIAGIRESWMNVLDSWGVREGGVQDVGMQHSGVLSASTARGSIEYQRSIQASKAGSELVALA